MVLGLLGMLLPEAPAPAPLPFLPFPQLSLALGRRHIPCSPLLRVRRAVFAAAVDRDERGGGREREIKEVKKEK